MNDEPVLPTSAVTLAAAARCVTSLSVMLPRAARLAASPANLTEISGLDNLSSYRTYRADANKFKSQTRDLLVFSYDCLP